MIGRDLARQGQAEPEVVRPRSAALREALEDALAVDGVEAGAVVADLEFDDAPAGLPQRDLDPAGPVWLTALSTSVVIMRRTDGRAPLVRRDSRSRSSSEA